MEFYNIKQCAADLAQADYIEELSKPAIKHFRIFDKRDSVIIYALNVRGAMQALADRLRVRGDDRCAPNSVDLRMYSDGYHSKTAHYTDADELTAEELTDVETDELNAALDFVSTIKYNRFSVREFEAIVNYLNAHFWAYYRPGNPNNYQKNYTLFFGRESSVVLYIEAKFENDVEIKKTIADLKRIARPDEIGIESEMPTWDGKRRARLRLWWD